MHSPKTLRMAIIGIMGVPLLLVVACILFFGYQEARKEAIYNLTTTLSERTTRQAAEVNLYFGKMSRFAETIATTLTATGPLEREAYTFLLDSVVSFAGITSAAVAFDDTAFLLGETPRSALAVSDGIYKRFSNFSKSEQYDYSFADWFLLPKLANRGMWTDPFFSSVQQRMVCSYGVPFFKKDMFQGVVGLSVSVEDILKNLEHINMQGSRLVLLSQVGTIVAHPNSDFILRHTFVSLAHERGSQALSDFASSLRGQPQAGVIRFDKGVLGDNEYVAYAPIEDTKWMLLSVIPEEVALNPLWRTVRHGGYVTLLGAVLVFVLGYVLSTREIVSPLLHLENASRRFAKGERNTRVPETSTIREILSMQCTFNSMVVQLGDSLDKELEAGRARSYAEETSKAKTDFLARMSHEIRTPMNAILGLTHLALTDLAKTDLDKTDLAKTDLAKTDLAKTDLDKPGRVKTNLQGVQPVATPHAVQQQYLLKIRRAGKSMLALINDILDFSKIEAGMLNLEIIPFNVTEVVHTLEDLFAEAAKDKGLEFRIEVAPEVPVWLMGDALRLTQILMNLCNNALKFTQQGSIVVTFDCADADQHMCMLLLRVKDTGMGIAAEAQKALFTKFTQADSSTTRKFGGTGLGLAICKLLSELMGGCITLESALGKGSTFTVGLPFDYVPVDSQPQDQSFTAGAELSLSPDSRILVAEDNEINQEIISALLGHMGLSCHVVSNGKEALQALTEQTYDLVLMDIQMPEMDGLTASATLREQGFTMPVLAMTANAMETDKQNCYAAGMNAHIAKPIDPVELHDKMVLWLNTKSPV